MEYGDHRSFHWRIKELGVLAKGSLLSRLPVVFNNICDLHFRGFGNALVVLFSISTDDSICRVRRWCSENRRQRAHANSTATDDVYLLAMAIAPACRRVGADRLTILIDECYKKLKKNLVSSRTGILCYAL